MNDERRTTSTRRPPRAEVVGSLLRPPRLLEMIDGYYVAGHTAKHGEERAKDDTALRMLEDEMIAEAVRRQIECGLDVVTDGEYRRITFINAFFDSMGGFGPHVGEPLRFVGDDGSVVEWPGAPTAVDRLSIIDRPVTREVEYLRSITDHPFKVTFPAGSFFWLPMGYSPEVTGAVYSGREEFVEHAIELQRELVADAIAAGCKYVQFDFPLYPQLVDPAVAAGLEQANGMSIAELTDRAIAADRRMLDGIPDDVWVSIHLCRGNYRSRWMAEGSLEPLAERVFNELGYDSFLVEYDDTRRQGDYSAIRFVPEDRIIVMGIINSKTTDVESEDDVVRRLEAAAEHLDIAQLGISTQCGFASGIVPGVGDGAGNETEEDAQWRKLELVARVADRVWPGERSLTP